MSFRVFRVVGGLMLSSEFFLTTNHTEYTENVYSSSPKRLHDNIEVIIYTD